MWKYQRKKYKKGGYAVDLGKKIYIGIWETGRKNIAYLPVFCYNIHKANRI